MNAGDDCRLLREAIELSRNAPASRSAFSVGCVIAMPDGTTVATGFSRERGPQEHAEQVALEKALAVQLDLTNASLYTSLEPCSVRGSGLRSCAQRILDAGISRVVFAMREPSIFVEGRGAEMLAERGVEVVELSAEAALVAAINAHLVEDP
jgi:diaminohydroxyphosphoribosylaminopyrimidine deaminase / 5-amino-6-(5-phosphoribosylamino)uracil reductase